MINEMDMRLTRIYSAAAIALDRPAIRAVCKQLRQFDIDAQARGLPHLAAEARQLRWQIVSEQRIGRGT